MSQFTAITSRTHFVYDNFRTIVDNGALARFPHLHAVVMHDSTRPVASISFAIDRAIWGTSPFGFHVTSLFLHRVNVVLVFLVARRAAIDAGADDNRRDRSLETAAVASTLFAVHPALTQGVGYISAARRPALRDGLSGHAAPSSGAACSPAVCGGYITALGHVGIRRDLEGAGHDAAARAPRV